jgi:hypothetical protein
VEVPVREERCDCEARQAYVPPPVEESCNCEAPVRPYAPSRMPRREYRDSQQVSNQTELEKD